MGISLWKSNNKEIFKSLITLPLIHIDMVEPLFNQIRINYQDKNLESLFEYYENIFIKKFPPKNYFNTDEHRSNNVCEAYNKRLNLYFNDKPTILKLINILTIEEEALVKDYSSIINKGYLSKRKKIGPSDYLSYLPYFTDKEKEYFSSKNSEIDIW